LLLALQGHWGLPSKANEPKRWAGGSKASTQRPHTISRQASQRHWRYQVNFKNIYFLLLVNFFLQILRLHVPKYIFLSTLLHCFGSDCLCSKFVKVFGRFFKFFFSIFMLQCVLVRNVNHQCPTFRIHFSSRKCF